MMGENMMKFDAESPEEALKTWMEHMKFLHPEAEHFTPTKDAPVFEMEIGTVNGRPISVYGIRYRRSGQTGPGLSRTVIWYEWDWRIDRGEATRQARFDLWFQSSDGYHFVPDYPDRITYEMLTAPFAEQEICRIEGEPLIAYLVLEHTEYSWGWEVTWRREKVREIIRKNLWHAQKPPTLVVPDWHDFRAVFPPMQEFHYGNCPETGEPLYRYGHLAFHWPSYYWDWTKDKEDAELRHAGAKEDFIEMQTQHKNSEEKEAAERLHAAEWHRLIDIRDKSRLRHVHEDIDPRLLQRFKAAYDERFEEESSAEVYMAASERCADIARAMKQALEQAELARLMEIEGKGLVAKLKTLLDAHLPTCPLCGQPYAQDNQHLEDLLVCEQAFLECACPKEGWESPRLDGESDTLPALAAELFAAPHDRAFREVRIPWRENQENYQYAYALRLIGMGKTAIVQAVMVSRNDGWARPGLIVDRAALVGAVGKSGIVDLWSRLRQTVLDRSYEEAEELVTRGHAVLVSFTWDAMRRKWSARDRQDGKTIVYAVDEKYRGEIQIREGQSYYCRIVKVPESARRPNFELIIVSPFQEGRK